MNLHIPLSRLPLSPAAAARQWSTSTLTRSRRNAMVALTALAERRSELDEAEASVEAAVRRRMGAPTPTRRATHGP